MLNTPYAILDTLLAEYTARHHPRRRVRPGRTRSAPARSPTSRSRPARPAPSPSTPTTGATPAFVDELQIQDFADDNAKVNALQAGQIQTLDNLPYNLIDTIEGAGGGVLIADGGQWVPFTMRVDQAPFDDVRVRQAMRLIVDRQAMIDQTLSGYGSLGNDLYAPLDVAYASDLPQREQDIDQAKSLLAAGRPGGAAGRAVHRRRHRLGGRPGGEPLRRAGQGGRRGRQGDQEDAVLRRRLPVLHRSPRTSGTPATTSRRPSSARSRPSRAAPTTRPTGTTRSTATSSTRRPRRSTRPSAPSCSTRRRRSSTTRAA